MMKGLGLMRGMVGRVGGRGGSLRVLSGPAGEAAADEAVDWSGSRAAETGKVRRSFRMKDWESGLAGDLGMVRTREGREASGLVAVEGPVLAAKALLHGLHLHRLYYEDLSVVEELPVVGGEAELVRVSSRRLRLWASGPRSPGLIALFRRPGPEDGPPLAAPSLPVRLVLDDGLHWDTDSLGHVLRVAAAAGAAQALLPASAPDPWTAEALKDGDGAQFSLPLRPLLWPQLQEELSDHKVPLFVVGPQRDSDESGVESVAHWSAGLGSWDGDAYVLLSGRTASKRARELVAGRPATRLHVPVSGQRLSLSPSTAAAIALFELKRQRSQAH